jgi:hypothetical protein
VSETFVLARRRPVGVVKVIFADALKMADDRG